MQLQRINQEASNDFSNFAGDAFPNESGQYGYTGLNDSQLDFGANADSFNNSLDENRTITMTIKNTLSVAQNVFLAPSFAPDNASIAPVMADGDILTGNPGAVTGSTSPYGYARWKSWFMMNPTHCPKITINSNDVAQMAQKFIVERKSPFANLQNQTINIQTFVDPINPNDKLVTVLTPYLVFDNQTQLMVTIPAGATTTFTLYLGAVYNTAQALSNKVRSAVNTIVRK